MKKQPVLTLEETPEEKNLIIFNIGLILMCWVLVISHYSFLPEQVPIHFGWNGQPNHWTSKNALFGLPVIGTGLIALLLYLVKIPHTHNYSVQITPSNAEMYYRASRMVLLALGCVVGLLFLSIVQLIIKSANQEPNSLIYWIVGLVGVGIILPFITWKWMIIKEKN